MDKLVCETPTTAIATTASTCGCPILESSPLVSTARQGPFSGVGRCSRWISCAPQSRLSLSTSVFVSAAATSPDARLAPAHDFSLSSFFPFFVLLVQHGTVHKTFRFLSALSRSRSALRHHSPQHTATPDCRPGFPTAYRLGRGKAKREGREGEKQREKGSLLVEKGHMISASQSGFGQTITVVGDCLTCFVGR